MKINIYSLSYDDLVELSHKIVERLRFLDSMHTHKEMMQFSPGDQVCFDTSGNNALFSLISLTKTSPCDNFLKNLLGGFF